MVIVFWIGWLSGDIGANVLFALVSFFALREFMTLSPTRRGDHRSLVLAFFVILPLQYTLVGTCLLYTSDAADERTSVDLGGRRTLKKKKQI